MKRATFRVDARRTGELPGVDPTEPHAANGIESVPAQRRFNGLKPAPVEPQNRRREK